MCENFKFVSKVAVIIYGLTILSFKIKLLFKNYSKFHSSFLSLVQHKPRGIDHSMITLLTITSRDASHSKLAAQLPGAVKYTDAPLQRVSWIRH